MFEGWNGDKSLLRSKLFRERCVQLSKEMEDGIAGVAVYLMIIEHASPKAVRKLKAGKAAEVRVPYGVEDRFENDPGEQSRLVRIAAELVMSNPYEINMPSVGELSRQCDMPQEEVEAAIEELESAGLLAINDGVLALNPEYAEPLMQHFEAVEKNTPPQ